MSIHKKGHPSITRSFEEAGSTLVETLVAVAILGSAIVILVVMITTGALGVSQINNKVRAESLVRSQLELIKDAPYQGDPIFSPYPAVTGIPGYSVSIDIEYWNASISSFQSAVRDDGLQKITVSVSSGSTLLTEVADYKVNR